MRSVPFVCILAAVALVSAATNFAAAAGITGGNDLTTTLVAVSPTTTTAPAEWRIEVDPAVTTGTPTIRAVTTGPAESLTYLITEIGTDTSKPMIMWSLPKSTTATIPLPNTREDTFVDVSITRRGSREPIFSWRTLLRPEGRPLIDYAGRDDFAPPEDFDAYWDRARAELAAVPMNAKVTRVPDRDTSTGLLHRVELDTVRDTKIVCWYFVPRDALDKNGKPRRKCPAVVIMPGYGAEEPPIDRTTSGLVTLSVNPRNHGPSREFWKSPVEHLVYNITEPENYYYRLAYLDCLRAAEFIFTRGEVDPDRVAAEGGSQGGLFAMALAALEPRIRCVCSNVTGFTAFAEGTRLARIGHHATFRQLLADGSTTATQARKSLTYTDGANMARRVKCPVQINMGDTDPVCPHVCGVVAYNRLPAGTTREFNITPRTAHAVPPEMRAHNTRWYQQHLLGQSSPPGERTKPRKGKSRR
ncbi:MAG: acetylxylan esterase [Candidatus Sumerlaeaceae bacterium]|nr:acetylxylan esterase [Candidatus Sumerlaeaceae bacterium]